MVTPEFTNDQPCQLSIVIPAYNEEVRLNKTLPRFLKYLKAQNYDWEIVVVNDGSRDKTTSVALSFNEPRIRVLENNPNRGKGYSIRRGMLEARGVWRLFSDADLSTPIEELDKFWTVTEEADVVIGSRALPESDLAVRQPKSRELAGRIFNTAVQTFLLPGLCDTQCGFKLFSAQAADAIFPLQTLHGFAFDVELLMLARKLNFKIKEVPVKWINDEGSKVSTMAGIKGFIDLARLSAKRFKS